MSRDCGWCGAPMRIVREYVQRQPEVWIDESTSPILPSLEIVMITAVCDSGHWYGGRKDDIAA